MKSKVLFSVIASASLFPFLLSSPARSWDPESEVRQQNQQRNQKHRLCDLAENNPTHLKYETMLNQLERKARVNGNQVTTVFVFTGPSAPFHQGCDVATLGKEESTDVCKNLYKIIGGNLVHYIKCPGRNTLKHVYKKVGSSSSSSRSVSSSSSNKSAPASSSNRSPKKSTSHDKALDALSSY